ncbi:MAG: hypothetical protein K2O18_11515 [Oscillospiraceae bacterium]|nr:hypothetical protein [Oscillospiraceae bacterium]
MELWIIWGAAALLSLLATAFTVGFQWGTGVSIGIGMIIFLWYCYESDRYEKWEKAGCPGDHIYLEWMRCKFYWRSTMEKYDANTHCKISFNDFQKYFSVNPSRYRFNIACVNFRNGNEGIILVFPRKELLKFFLFRRSYLQSRRMVDVVNAVQGDIDKLREDAQEQLDKAKALLNMDFKTE